MALGYRSRASVASPHPQRHITVGATEILCGPPHKISHTHFAPSGSFEVARHSMGSMNSAARLGSVSSFLPGGPVMSIVYGYILVGMLNTDRSGPVPGPFRQPYHPRI